MDDRDRRTTDRRLLEGRERVLEAAAGRALDRGAYLRQRHGGPGVETGAELARHQVAEDPRCGGDELPELDERAAQLLERAPQRPGEGVVRRGTSQQPAGGEAAEVSGGHPGGLERTAAELPAGRTGQRPGGWARAIGHAASGCARSWGSDSPERDPAASGSGEV